MESWLHTGKVRIDSEVAGVGSMTQFQEAMLNELRSGIHSLQHHDHQIVWEATDLCAGIHREQKAMCKRIPNNGL